MFEDVYPINVCVAEVDLFIRYLHSAIIFVRSEQFFTKVAQRHSLSAAY